MKNMNSTDIEKLCDDWCLASTTAEDNIELGTHTEKYRLLQNGIIFHELDHETLCAAVIGLSKVILRPGLHSVIDKDHTELWSWCAEILVGRESNMFSRAQMEIENLYKTAFHAALAHCGAPTGQGNGPAWAYNIQKNFPHHAQQLIFDSSLVLAYLVFPLLEAILKRACAKYLTFDGKIILAFSVTTRYGKIKNYDPRGGKFGYPQCSSMRDMLFLHYNFIADPHLKYLLDKFLAHLSSINNSEDPFDMIYDWRNQSLHGSANFATIGGTVLNLSILISLFEIKKSYEELRQRTIERFTWNVDSPVKAPWSFYPLS